MKRNLAVWTIAAAICMSGPSTAFAEPSPEQDQDAVDQIIDNDDHVVGEEMCAWPARWRQPA